jgi:chromosomal replication initiation ATPase DnaA
MISPEVYVGLETSIPMRDRIVKAVCQTYGTTLELLQRKCRERQIVEPRQMCVAFEYMATDAHIRTVGVYFGLHHSTITYAVRSVYNLYKTNCLYREKANEVITKLGLHPDFIKNWVIEKRGRY